MTDREQFDAISKLINSYGLFAVLNHVAGYCIGEAETNRKRYGLNNGVSKEFDAVGLACSEAADLTENL